MAALTLNREAIVLERRAAAADDWERLALFTADEGSLSVLRRSRRSKPVLALDLFDHASVVLESSDQGHTWFLMDGRLLRRLEGLGRSYARLAAASALARLALRNPIASESRPGLYRLLHAAFAALAETDRPDVVLLKSLYRFARDEGYPVRQQWREDLPASDQATLDLVLERPVREVAVPPEAVERLHRKLGDYLRANTELALD